LELPGDEGVWIVQPEKRVSLPKKPIEVTAKQKWFFFLLCWEAQEVLAEPTPNQALKKRIIWQQSCPFIWMQTLWKLVHFLEYLLLIFMKMKECMKLKTRNQEAGLWTNTINKLNKSLHMRTHFYRQ
jgi:hypothetical protein